MMVTSYWLVSKLYGKLVVNKWVNKFFLKKT
jgi:hypothetical protein